MELQNLLQLVLLIQRHGLLERDAPTEAQLIIVDKTIFRSVHLVDMTSIIPAFQCSSVLLVAILGVLLHYHGHDHDHDSHGHDLDGHDSAVHFNLSFVDRRERPDQQPE